MAKVKNFLASGQSGKIGDVVYYKGANGQTIVRKTSAPKNPNTLAQRYQRVIIKTINKQYQAYKALADHAFEGKTMGAQSMNRFMQLNARAIRTRAVEIQSAGQSLSQYYNFMPLKSERFSPAAVYISEGTLPQVPVTIGAVANFDCGDGSYKGIIDKYQLRRGDQLTFVCVVADAMTGENVFRFARIILDPRNADGSGAALTEPLIVDGAVNKANFRNAGVFTELVQEDDAIAFNTGNGEVVAAGIIVSRKDDKKYWFRSTCKLTISEENLTDKISLEEAATEVSGDLDLVNDDAYLNNAGTGGGEGSQSAPSGSTDPVYGQVSFNGLAQSVAGGSVAVTAPLETIRIQGMNLTNADLNLKVNDGGVVHPTTNTGREVVFGSINAVATDTVVVYRGEDAWFTVSVQAAAQGGGDDEGQN